MNMKTLTAVCAAALLIAGTYVYAQGNKPASGSTADPRIDKILEQQDQILKNQAEILKQLGELKNDLMQLRRRSS